MADYNNPSTEPHRSITAGTIRRIKLENFMCHCNLEIEFGDYVNFITGQNGNGKSAILTALCVAFGSRAKATNRASTLKVAVVLKNEGMDAFKPETYRESIIIERRITESSSSLVLKDHQGRKVSNKKEELWELIEHFNIDVENPCVIMTQDKSREFLQSGNAKDKFKATLLQQIDDLLCGIEQALETASELVQELERTIEPVVRELNELQEKIKNTERVEELSERVNATKLKLAWSWVYSVKREILKESTVVEKRKSLLPACQAKIDQSSPLHKELYTLHAANFLLPSFLIAVHGNTEESFRSIMTEPAPGIFTFDMLQPQFCVLLLKEVENIEKWVCETNCKIMWPNTMNRYGAVLDDFGMETLLDKLMKDFVCPISKVFFSEVGGNSLDSHHGFVVLYGIDDLRFHVDDAEVTLNICLGQEFSGGELFFQGVRCEKHVNTETQAEEIFYYSHVPGRAVLHRGRHRHGARAATDGKRFNLILWCRSSVFRELKKYYKDFSSCCGECQQQKKERQQLSISATKEELLKKEGEPTS